MLHFSDTRGTVFSEMKPLASPKPGSPKPGGVSRGGVRREKSRDCVLRSQALSGSGRELSGSCRDLSGLAFDIDCVPEVPDTPQLSARAYSGLGRGIVARACCAVRRASQPLQHALSRSRAGGSSRLGAVVCGHARHGWGACGVVCGIRGVRRCVRCALCGGTHA